jgi:ATP-dependent Clp protease ATP-binding subunit ClpA
MERSVKTILIASFIVGALMFFLKEDLRVHFHTWTLILALAGFVPLFVIFASIYLVKKMYKNQIHEESKPKVNSNTYYIQHPEYLQSLPPYERAKKKLQLFGLTKDKRYLLTPEESDALLQKARERRMAEEMSLNRPVNTPSNASRSTLGVQRSTTRELDIDDLEKYLKSKVIGQDDAIKMLADAIYQQARAKSQNLGSYLFVGQTGVGKTETAKALAEYLKDYGYAFYRFDMNSFTQEHTASTLLGAPKGYIGSEEGGLLPRKLLENPRAVILFDEIEKAHHSLYRVFMTLIDEGYVQEVTTGMRVPAKNSIFIFTSNLYQETISTIISSDKDEVEKEMLILDVLTGKVQPLPTDYLYTDQYGMPFRFPAEFVARLTKVVPFRKLSYQDLEKIAIKIVGNRDKAVRLTKELYPLAEKYGVRVFVKKIKESL